MIDNVKLLVKPRAMKDDSELEVLNGIRVVMTSMVILGNTYFYILRGPLMNIEVAQEWMQNKFFAIILSTDLLVDTFFWLSAFLASYQILIRTHTN